MKLKRNNLFIAISSITLLMVLVIQVMYIFQTAKIKEELFNEKANIILARTTDALRADKEMCRNMETFIGKNEIHKIDSLFTYFMKFYNFKIEYSFEIIHPGLFQSVSFLPDPFPLNHEKTSPVNFYPDQPACYKKSLEVVAQNNGMELKLIIPEKNKFLLEEMGTTFITSVLLILIVLFMFWRTVVSLIKEKRISEHTTDFLNNMTHEFKTPLTNIALAGKMIIKDSTNYQENKIKQYSEIILEENEKLRLQVEQVLSMTALERGEIPVQKVKLDFHALIKDSLKSISIQINNKKGNIQTALTAEKFEITGDKTHLTNAICNLVDNAIKYSAECPDITIRTFNSNENLIITVADKGIGMDKEYQNKIYDKYFRIPTGDVHNVKGFGLGLAYIKTIIALHGGSISHQSEKEKGTTFTITLPNV
ncbi:MAG: HAMP domain-containing sensor histidine kinase [Bacteroidota bacterium]